MPVKGLQNPEDVVILDEAKATGKFLKQFDPFRGWQLLFTRENRIGRGTYNRNNNNTKILPFDKDHYSCFKFAGYFRSKPENTEGWHIIYYPAMICWLPGWVAITREDIEYDVWTEWCQSQNALAAALNKDYKPWKKKQKKSPGRHKKA